MDPMNYDTVTFPSHDVVLAALQKNEKLSTRYNPPKTLIDAIADSFASFEWRKREIKSQVEVLSTRVSKNKVDNWNPQRDYPHNISAIVEILNGIGTTTLNSKSMDVKYADKYNFPSQTELLNSLQQDEYLMKQTKNCQVIIPYIAKQFANEKYSEQVIEKEVHTLVWWYNLQPEFKKIDDQDRDFIERVLSDSLKNIRMPPLNPSKVS